MAIIKGKPLPLKFIKNLTINPFLVLGVQKGSSKAQVKSKFREKLIESRDNNELRSKICLAYDMIVNKDFYEEVEKDVFTVKSDLNKSLLGYFYTVIGDFLDLVNEIEENPAIIFYKDPL